MAERVRLRHRSPGFVRRLRRYYAGVRLLWVVHQRLRFLTFPLRTIRPQQGLWPIQRSPGSRTRSVRTCQGLRGKGNELFDRKTAMPFIHRLCERVGDPGTYPDQRRLLDAELGRDLISGAEADAAD
jgi:hypothetical protein